MKILAAVLQEDNMKYLIKIGSFILKIDHVYE